MHYLSMDFKIEEVMENEIFLHITKHDQKEFIEKWTKKVLTPFLVAAIDPAKATRASLSLQKGDVIDVVKKVSHDPSFFPVFSYYRIKVL